MDCYDLQNSGLLKATVDCAITLLNLMDSSLMVLSSIYFVKFSSRYPAYTEKSVWILALFACIFTNVITRFF